MYMRISRLKYVMKGAVAASAAQYQPARRPKRLRAAQNATGMDASPNVSDKACVAASEFPKSRIQTWRSK